MPLTFSPRFRSACGSPRSKPWRPLVAVATDLEVEPLRERVDDRDPDPVQAAGDLVAAALAELAAGMQRRQHDLGRRALLLRVLVDRDPASVVDHGDRVVGMDRDLDLVAVAGERLVDRVVDDLVDEVVQAAWPGRADVHAGPLADRVEAAQDGDLTGGVAVRARPSSTVAGFAPAPALLATSGPFARSHEKPRPPDPGEGPIRAARGKGATSHKDTSPAPGTRSACTKIPANHALKRIADPSSSPTTKRSSSHPARLERPVERARAARLQQVELLRPGRRAAGDRDHALALAHRLRLAARSARRPPRASSLCTAASRVAGSASRAHRAQRLRERPRLAARAHAAALALRRGRVRAPARRGPRPRGAPRRPAAARARSP